MKIILLLKRRSDLTPEQFREHYENQHVKLAERYLGHLYTDYRRNYAKPGLSSAHLSDDSPYDVVTEMWLRDQAAWDEMLRIIADPEVNRILVEDEERFLDRAAQRMFVSDEVISPPRR